MLFLLSLFVGLIKIFFSVRNYEKETSWQKVTKKLLKNMRLFKRNQCRKYELYVLDHSHPLSRF